jgi:integrase
MNRYLPARQRLPNVVGEPLLCTRHRGLRPYTGAGIAQGLRCLFVQAGVRTVGGQVPRIHDMRHSFALQALLRWYRAGVDVQAKLPALATYMGHASALSTQHYLALLEPFAEAASERFARHCATFLPAVAPDGGAR